MSHCSIPDMLAIRDAIAEAAKGLPDEPFNKVMDGAWAIEMAILGQPAASADDVEIKLRLWDDLVADPASILDKHRPLWEQLKADWRKVIEDEVDAAIEHERMEAGIAADRAFYEN
ncbi:MAG: hypothetical protein JWM58_3926 [Rhizobium sp.]|nr:hypothetical protein [Rhizobium sp.]